jgi:putative Mn2+ efflux pump MntP
MNFIDVALVSLSMSADSMTVGATDGICEPNMSKVKLFLISTTFGFFQFAMPVIGYFIGYSWKNQLEAYIPWIAFALLTLLSLKSIIEWIKERKETKNNPDGVGEVCKRLTPLEILTQGIATSIDALCIGFVYLDQSITDAMLIFGIIGISTFCLSLLTTFLGKKIGNKLIKWAGLVAGIVFFATGLKILLEGIL